MAGVIIGIDFGSKKSGFTAVALYKNGRVEMLQAAKNKDADDFLKGVVEANAPTVIGIDAPLSLPGALQGLDGFENFHMRKADLDAGAMSPMFLGGLTARAMEFAHWCRRQGISVYETYPKLVAQQLNLDMNRYKKDPGYMNEAEAAILKGKDKKVASNWHQIDALLALEAALKIDEKCANSLGNELEGVIYF